MRKRLISFEKLIDGRFDLNYILVDDGSSKDYIEAIKHLQFPNLHYHRYKENKGKGFALRYGIGHSHSPYVLFTDIDIPYKNRSMLNVIEKLITQNADAIIGIRDDSYYKYIPNQRKYISKALRFINRKVLKLVVDDTQCGLKAFNSKGKEIFLSTTTNRYLIDLEFIKKLTKSKSIVKTQFVNVREDLNQTEISNSRIIEEFWSFLKIIFSK